MNKLDGKEVAQFLKEKNIELIKKIKEKNEEIKTLKISNASFRNMAVEEGLLPQKFRVDNPEVKMKIGGIKND